MYYDLLDTHLSRPCMYRVHVRREASIRHLLRLSNPHPSRPAKYGAEVIWLAHCMQSVLESSGCSDFAVYCKLENAVKGKGKKVWTLAIAPLT